ncbi:MAG: hypothetical protein V1837_05795 [Candidatus Woesearchaeota archaeon]
MNKALVFTILLLLLAGCTNLATKTELIDHGNFSIAKPLTWTEKEDSGIYSYTPTAKDSGERISFFISVVPLNMSQSLEKLIDLGLTNAKQKFKDLNIITKARKAKLGQLDGLQVQFNGTVGQNSMTFTQIFAKQQNRIYTLTYACPSNVCNSYGTFYQIASDIKIR